MNKTVYFGDNEDKVLNFVNNYADRVDHFGYDKNGWYVVYITVEMDADVKPLAVNSRGNKARAR